MITCQDILELQLDGVELIAGEKGLTRPVTWTYMVQTRPFEEHMNQGNFALCVVDYVRFDLEEARESHGRTVWAWNFRLWDLYHR